MKITNQNQSTARSLKAQSWKSFAFGMLLLFTSARAAPLIAADRFTASFADGNPGKLIWDSPSADARGSMPIGNGDIGLNVWVEPSGDLCFFIGKTDAWDENQRLLKLGKVRVKLTPALVQSGQPFSQTLDLATGRILIRSGDAEVIVWVDANHPVIQVDAKSVSGQPLTASVAFEMWRKEKRALENDTGGGEYHSTGFTSLPAFSWPDTVLASKSDQIGWYHRNAESPWLASLKLQKVEAIAATEKDPILNRTCGAILRGKNFIAASPTELKTAEPATAFSLCIDALTRVTDTPEAWQIELESQADAIGKMSADARRKAHVSWWKKFWNRSWIYVNEAEAPKAVSLPVNGHPWRVGLDSQGASRFGGEIAGAQVFGRALGAAEIATLGAAPHPGAGSAIRGADSALTTACTLAAWIKPGTGEAGRILDKCTAGHPDGLTFDTYPGLSLRWIVGERKITADHCLKAGEWQHVAATVDAAGRQALYVNGKSLAQNSDDILSSAQRLTRAYILQRFINACGGRGDYPIKFNGSIFVVDNKYDADYRLWGGCYWFQNTRLTYWSMLEAGDFDLMRPFFDLYMKVLPVRKLATKNYYNHDGAFFPETMSIWGNYTDQGDLGYGTNRKGKPDGLTDNTYVRRYWQGGLEMVAMMLDYHDCTQDTTFRDQTLLPFARETVAFFDQHWKRDTNGKILFDPAQSLETWHTAKNPLPEIAGLRYVIPRLLALPVDEATRSAWSKTLADMPPVPTHSDKGGVRLAPAETYGNKANVENPELYAIFPYRLYTLAAGSNAVDIADNAWFVRRHRENRGWQQNSIQAALLGHANEARDHVLDNSAPERTAPGFRFPAMWGPHCDWMPDQDHGTVMMSALQRMLMQCEGSRILLLPAWPKEWNVSFKLHAPDNTTVEGTVEDGKIKNLKVTPESRRKDIVMGVGSPGDGPR
ncbi:MAG: DUF5703 domain-containing protein [Verrucomicrobiota bacterium]